MKHFIAPKAREVILTNAKVILSDEVIEGTLWLRDGHIVDIGQGRSRAAGVIDCEGDFLCPGLVELHTDNLERHLEPRPGVKFPLTGAILAHDAELASVGITTVFDALRVGSIVSGDSKKRYDKYARFVVDELLALREAGALKISHHLHLRAEVCSETLIDELTEFKNDDRVGIISLMDHTPGQRQFRDVSKMDEYLIGKYGMERNQIDAHYAHLREIRAEFGDKHIDFVVSRAKELGTKLASHDDTTVAEVEGSRAAGVSFAEFPTTIEAARACRDLGIGVMMGAPNLMRGKSHSGNVSAGELADAGLLDILSSDYVPSTLLAAAVKLSLITDDFAAGMRTVTQAPAGAVGLDDRGEIAHGKRADLIQFSVKSDYPVLKRQLVMGV